MNIKYDNPFSNRMYIENETYMNNCLPGLMFLRKTSVLLSFSL